MMLGMVLAALYASPTTVPIATPMMRVRRKPVPRDAIVPSAILRLVRSAPAGVPDLPPIDRRLPGRAPGTPDHAGEPVGAVRVSPVEWRAGRAGRGRGNPRGPHPAAASGPPEG